MDRLNTSFLKNVFSSGGYSAVYGQALSGVLALESIDLPEKMLQILGFLHFASGEFSELIKKKHIPTEFLWLFLT